MRITTKVYYERHTFNSMYTTEQLILPISQIIFAEFIPIFRELYLTSSTDLNDLQQESIDAISKGIYSKAVALYATVRLLDEFKNVKIHFFL